MSYVASRWTEPCRILIGRKLVRFAPLVALVTCTLGCEDKAQTDCNARVQGAEVRMVATNLKDKKSIEATMDELKGALAACGKAGDQAATKDIDEAIDNFSQHLVKLEQSKDLPKAAAIQSVTTEELLKSGDPNCPRGQSWMHPALQKEILCSGPSLFEMKPSEAITHLPRTGFALNKKGEVLEFRRKERVYRYHFDKLKAEASARCLQIGLAAEETVQQGVAMATGVQLSKIELGKPVPLQGREIALTFDDKERAVSLGDCEGVAPLLAVVRAAAKDKSEAAAQENSEAAPQEKKAK